MHTISKRLQLIGYVILICLCVNKLNAQTPADDPGIGGPGTTLPAGDGAPIVPFDGGMSLVLLASGIAFATKKVKAI